VPRTKAILYFLFAFTAGSAQAAPIISAYTDFDVKKCKTESVDSESGSATLTCSGYNNFAVTYAEDDLRGTIAFGKNPNAQCSSHQTFSNFNSPGPRIEWRLEKAKPFATIMRWTTENGVDGTKHGWLVVTKLDGPNTCRTALVDAQFPQANTIARQRADSTRNFNCEKDLPEIVSRMKITVQDFLTGEPCVKN
jgi:hypothetical protein